MTFGEDTLLTVYTFCELYLSDEGDLGQSGSLVGDDTPMTSFVSMDDDVLSNIGLFLVLLLPGLMLGVGRSFSVSFMGASSGLEMTVTGEW